MYIKNTKISLIYKIIAAIISFAGFSMFIFSFGIEQAYYYTIQSNILCAVYFILAVIYISKEMKSKKDEPIVFMPRFKGAVVIAITVTMIIFWGLLSNSDFTMDPETLATMPFVVRSPWPNYIVHSIVPLLMIFDWLLFDPKGVFKKIDPFIWIIIPYVYLVFAEILAATGYTFSGGSRFPYFFIDSDLIGWNGVFLYVVVLTIFFIVLGYLALGFNRILAKISKNK